MPEKKHPRRGAAALLVLAILLFTSAGCALKTGAPVFPRLEPDYNAKRPLEFSPFAAELDTFSPRRVAALDAVLIGKSIPQIQRLLRTGRLTSVELTLWYLDRIRRYDVDRLNSVLELNPEALVIAARRDAERRRGRAGGPMFGIPVLLKDNIATHDRMHTTAGAYAMKHWRPARDAFLVRQLRRAGAVILGKANLSEWANYMDPAMPSGFSDLGGQTRNPYGPYEVWGSSSGSAVAAAAGLAAVTVGTETMGSLIMPADINGVVAIKTSRGLVSRDNIIPLIDWMDVPGPMARSVTDAAVLLTAMTGTDRNDSATLEAASLAGTDFTRFLDLERARKLRVGIAVHGEKDVAAFLEGSHLPEKDAAAVRATLAAYTRKARRAGSVFRRAGIALVEVAGRELPPKAPIDVLLQAGFKDSLNRFLSQPQRRPPVDSLARVIAVNDADPHNRAPYGQRYLVASRDTRITPAQYAKLRDLVHRGFRSMLHEVFAKHGIDVLVTYRQSYAPAGLPAITVPAGYDDHGQPFGVTMIADFLGEPKLITAAYAYEHFTRARREPDLPATLQAIERRMAEK